MSRKPIYLDNAATSWPKPPAVAQAVAEYITQSGVSIRRGSYRRAWEAEETLLETRELVGALFGAGDARNVVFSSGATESMNQLVKGLVRAGDHVMVSAMEHNAVLRPLRQLERRGVTVSVVPCRADGSMDPAALAGCLRPETRLLVMTHASNVCGTILPVREAGAFCRAHGLVFAVDAAQTAGVIPLSMDEIGADAVVFAGHKGLMGPQGTGGMVIRPALAERLEPLIAGGTGSASRSEDMPAFLPDRLEAGTMNLPGLMGLRAGLVWLKETGIDAVRRHELALTERFLNAIADGEREGLLRLVGRQDTEGRCGVVSVQTLRRDAGEAAGELDRRFGIMTRVGLHCAPSAHRTLGTLDTGTIRFSFGCFNTEEETDRAAEALVRLLRE